ncbi:restriction endonuclease subunit S [Enterobacter cloacae complex sp. P12RS]|uniref:restriction endonuclease subunit S n=1 Tax=Enterobacter TaxID=547 RepID=UPI0009081E11|nr:MULTISPECIES: restriction endonuclease subunit S [Enterobacter]MBE3490775.1 restriction endonuclease subunit S [Enterobacter cloacae complex sp. P12RS]MCK6699092.1 restriction endonuclease subunit S [Enterobacter bugandensis]
MGNEYFKLPPGWHCRSLVDCTKGGNISYGIVQPGQHQDDGIRIIRVNNIQNGKISVADVLKVSHDVESKFSKTRLEGGEVLLTLVGSTGLSAITTKDLHGWNVARAIAVIKPSDEISAEWIHICLQSPYTKYFLDSRANTTVQKTLNLKDVKEIPLPIPPIEERMNLEKIYFDLESKINLNLEINQTLEQMSQTLFKSWFVDFDPVIDNALDAGNPIPEALQSRAELRQKDRNSADFKPLPADIRVLFPAEFEETELGWVPKGWITTSFNDLIELIGGGTPKTSVEEYWNGDIPWFSVVDAPNESDVYVLTTEKNITTEGLNNSSAKLLRKGTTIISARGTVGKCAMVAVPMAMNQSCYGVIGKNNISDEYIYFQLKNAVQTLQQMGHGSVFNTITRDTFKNIKVPFCNEELTNSYSLLVKNYFSKILNNNYQNIALSNLRDTLLPKLISGELSLEGLPDLIKQTEAA